MKSLLLAAVVGVAAVNAYPWNKEFTKEDLKNVEDLVSLFDAWKNFFGKDYLSGNTDEEFRRYAIWAKNLERIAAMNSEDHTFKLRLNQFADLTDGEFREMYSCVDATGEKKESTEASDEERARLPDSVDWTTKGVVTPVKDQGQCGSCWAFSATGSMECQYAIAHGKLVSLSEQQLVDCSGSYGNHGCNGGWYYDAWKYAESVGGLCLESDYKYTGRDGSCKASSCGTKHNDPKSYSRVTADSETALETAAAEGCVSVAIEADQFAFQYYSSGVLTGTCGTRTDHAVLVVGYGREGSQDYWKVKNSWGTSWGERGYVYICRDCNKNGNKGECGIDMYPYTVKER